MKHSQSQVVLESVKAVVNMEELITLLDAEAGDEAIHRFANRDTSPL